MVIIKFDTASAAFDEDASLEITRILSNISDQIHTGNTARQIVDVNGNKIGQWEFTP